MTHNDSHEPETNFPRGLSKPAQRALAGAGYTQLEQLTNVTEAEVLTLHGMGPKAPGLLQGAQEIRGLTSADRSGGQA